MATTTIATPAPREEPQQPQGAHAIPLPRQKKKTFLRIPIPTAIGLIAASHGASIRLAGILVSGAYYFSLLLSFACTCIGVAHNAQEGKTFQALPGWMEGVVCAFLGIFLACVFAGLTISSIRKVREAKSRVKKFFWGIPLVVGMGFSTLADHEAWALIFIAGNAWKAWAIAAGVSFAIFCLEIAPKSHEDNVRESVSRNPVVRQARHEEINEMIDQTEFESLSRNLSSQDFLTTIDSDGVKALRLIMAERMQERKAKTVEITEEKNTDSLQLIDAPQVDQLPERASSKDHQVEQTQATTGEFTTLDDSTQKLYHAVRKEEDIIRRLLSGEENAVLVAYLCTQYPDNTDIITPERVQAIITTLRNEETITDKLEATQEESKPEIRPAYGGDILEAGKGESIKAILQKVQKDPEMRQAILAAHQAGASLQELAQVTATYLPVMLRFAVCFPPVMQGVIDALQSDDQPQIDTDQGDVEIVEELPLQLPEIPEVAQSAPRKTTTRKQPTAPRKKRQFEERSVPTKTKYTPQIENDLVDMLSVNPDLTLGTIEGRYNISENTARSWRNKAKTAIKIRQSEAQEA